MNIVLTGAADGLGKEIALLLKDHNLILVDYAEAKLKEVAKQVKSKQKYVCDLTSVEDVENTTAKILNKNKKIDVVINCAGAWLNEATEQDLNKFRRMILVNMFGTIAFTKCLLPRLIEQKDGFIININSQAGVHPEAGSPVYSATKAGLIAYRKAIKKDLGNNGIKITDIHPGMIETGLFQKAGVEFPQAAFDNFSLKKADVASVVKWLIDQPSYVSIPALEIKNRNENLN